MDIVTFRPMNKTTFILVGSAGLLAILAALGRPAPPSRDEAYAVLTRCVENEGKGCYFEKDGTRRSDVQGRRFAAIGVEDDPKLAVANYHFATKDRQFCGFVQFEKDQAWWTAEFYRCSNKAKLNLGIG